MTLNESTVANATVKWFDERAHSVGRGAAFGDLRRRKPQMVLDAPAMEHKESSTTMHYSL